MDEQILKDFIATAQANGYKWDVVIAKFPELSGYDPQLLKDYVATAEANNYNYAVVNAKFPEFFGEVKKKEEPSVASSQEEQLASPMETPTLASLPGRDLTLPPSPRLAPQTQQAIQEAGGVAPQEQPIPVPYEARPTEVVTEEGITMDLETAGITGETGVSPEAQAAMETRVEEGAVEMPKALVGEGVQAAQDYLDKLERQRIDELKENYKRWVGIDELAMAGANLVSMLYPSGLPGSEFIDRTASEMTQAYLENAGLTPEETRKSFSEQDSFEKGAIKFGVDVMNAMALSALAASTMGTTALAGVGTAETFGLAAGAEATGVYGLLQNALKTVSGNIAKNPLNFGLMGHVGSNMAWKEVKDNPNMSTEEKVAYATFSGMKEMLTEAGFVGDFRAWNESLSMAERAAAKNTFKEIMKDYSSNLAKQGLEEGTEEGISWSGDLIWNLLSGEELPSARSGWEAMAVGAVAPASSVTAQYAPAIADYAAGAVLPYTLPKSENLAKLSDLKSKSSQIQKDIDAEGVSEEEKDRLLQAKKQVDDEISNLRSEAIKERESMSMQDQISLAVIDAQVEKLYDEFSKAKTGSAKAIIKQEVKSLLDSKRKIEQGDAIQKQTTDESMLRPEEPEVGLQEVGERDQEPEVAPEAGVEEEVVTPTAEVAVTEEVTEPAMAETLSEEEQQQLADLRAETAGQAPAAAATSEEVTAVFEGGRKVSANLSVNEAGAETLSNKESSRRAKIEKLAQLGAKAIEKLFPDTKIILHATGEEFAKNTGTAATDEGAFLDNVIHINLSKADASTVAHEVFHAIFVGKLKTDSKTQDVAKKMIEAIRKDVPDGSSLALYLDAFAENYEESFRNEEKIAQLTGLLSVQYQNFNPTTKQKIVEFLQRLARAFGVKLPSEFGKTDESVTAMLDVISRKVAKGKKIVAADLVILDKLAEPGSTVASGTVAENINEKGSDPININATRKQQLNRGGIDIDAIKRGSINDLSGANAFVFAADQATYGEIESPSGTRYYFKGGYLYPYGSGMGWAFTSEVAANKILKKVKESDGVGLVMSQASDGIAGSLSFYDYLMAEIQNAVMKGASPQELIDYVNAKLRTASRTPGVTIAEQLEKKGHKGQIETLEDLRGLMPIEGRGVISYDTRGSFTKSFFSAASYERFGIPPLVPTAKMNTGVLDYVNDPSLEKVQYGDIISAIQFDKNSKVIDTRKEGMDTHPSYPFVIEGTPIMVFDKAVDVRKVYPKAKPVTGPQVEIGERAKPQAARSAMGAQYVAEIPTDIVEEPTVITLEDALPVAQLTGEQQMAIENIKVKKPALRQKKAMTNEEARASIEQKQRKMYPTTTDDSYGPEEMRVYYMDQNFEWFRDEPYGPVQNVANIFAHMASQDGVYMFPSIFMREAMMFMDMANGGKEVDINLSLRPRKGNTVYVEGVEVVDINGRKQGAGTRLMNRLVAAADELGIALTLEAYPTTKFQVNPATGRQLGDVKLSKMAKDLTKFYEKFGFEVVGRIPYSDMWEMKRSPQTLEGKNAIRQKKGLITITPTEGIKYQKAGIQEKYQQEAIKMIGELIPSLNKSESKSLEEADLIDSIVGDLIFQQYSADDREAESLIYKVNLKDIDDVVLLANKLFPGFDSPSKTIDKFLESFAAGIARGINWENRYLVEDLNVVDSDAITKDILWQAKEADRMGLSRRIVKQLESKVNDKSSRKEVIAEYGNAQIDTIKNWSDFLRFNQDIPPAIRLMLFDAVVTHNYDARTGSYRKRNNRTLRNYMPYDEGIISRMVGEQSISSDAVLKEYVETMMANAPNVVRAFKMYDTAEGTWLKFPGGDGVSAQDIRDNANALSQLVQDTPWCTKTSAESQLERGDFYVFVTTDKHGLPKARIAVRTADGRVQEVRGILEGQQMETDMNPVAEQFLESGAVPGGDKWAEGQRVNQRVKQFREEILKRPLTLQDFKTISEIKNDVERYDFMQYGDNGFMERLQEDFNLKIESDDLVPELLGKVATKLDDIKSTTEIFIGDLNDSRLFSLGIRDLAKKLYEGGVELINPGRITTSDVSYLLDDMGLNVGEHGWDVLQRVFPSPYTAETGEFTSIHTILHTAAQEMSPKVVLDILTERTKNLKIIQGNYFQRDMPVIKSLKTVTGNVDINSGKSTENIESVGRLTISSTDEDFEIGLKEVGILSILNPIKSLGKLETADVLSINETAQRGLESLGNLKSVGENFHLDRANSLKSLGQLEEVGGYIFLPRKSENIKTLGKLRRIGGFLGEVPSYLESLGELEQIGEEGTTRGFELNSNSKLKDLGKLRKIYGLTIKNGAALKSLGPNLKEIENGLTLEDWSVDFDFGGLETVGGSVYVFHDTNDKKRDFKINMGQLKSVGAHFAVFGQMDSLGELETVGAGFYINASDKFKDTGKLKSVGEDFQISVTPFQKDDDAFPIVISNLISVGGDVQIRIERIKSLGSIKKIGGIIKMSPYIRSSGDLLAKSVDAEFYSDSIDQHNDGRISTQLFSDIERLYGENLRAEAGVEPPPAIRQKKGDATAYQNWSAKPQSQAQLLGHRFNMNHKGFVPATTDPAQFRIAVRKLDDRLSTKRYYDERNGKVRGYSMTLDGKFFNPFLRVIGGGGSTNSLRRQGYGAGTQSIYEFINDVRERGYTDRVIAAFLKEQGYSATEIKSALAVPIDVMGTLLPDGFANAEGGVAQGQAFFNELTKKIKRYANAKRLGVLLHNAADVRAKAQEMLVNSPFFKAQSPTIQAEMQIGLDKALNIPAANKKFQADFKALRAMLSNMKKGAAEMDKAKRAMRMFIRKNLPKTVFDKADVNKLMKAITDATPDSLPAVMERVTGFVNEFYVRDLSAAIGKLLKTPTTRMVSGRRVGRVSVSLQNILGLLTNKKDPMLVDEGMSPENIEVLMKNQQDDFNKESVKTTLTQGESDKMNALSIALMYNEAMLMEDNNPHKVDALAAVRDNLRTLISTGRSQMRGELDAQRAYYEQLISDAYNGITGEALDLSEEGEKANKENLRELKNKEQRRKTFDGGIKSFIGKIKNSVDEFFTKQMDLALLLQRISSGLSEAMGGNKLMEIFDERLFKARVSFVSGKKQVFDIISNKAKEIWGDNYKLEMQRNAVPVVSKDLINDKNVIWLNEDKANELKKEYDSATKKRKAQIIKELEKLELRLSNNQAYYLYNQYKDPANVASFENEDKFGKDHYARIMQQVTDRLDAKTKEWADWQVNELYPSLYERYNEVYKAIYRTNMPWNQFYAGRIFREGEEGDLQFDLLAGSSEYQTSVGGQSTKARVKNARPIQSVDGNSVLNSYLKDMEYFRAYAEAMRDLSKVLDNANVKAAIIELGGKNAYDALKDMMQKVARKGVSQNESQLANAMMGMYVKSKLAINPTVFLKQLTSAFAFADYIGYTNWSKYTALALPQARKLWKEWYANSPLLQERYENSNIGDILEGYTYEGSLNESPILINKKVGGKEITVTKEQTRNLMNSLMYLVKQGDKGGIMGGLANYLYYKQQYLEKNPGDEAGAQKYASEKATKEALRTQQDSGITNKDWFQTGGPAYRFLNVFLSSPKALLRREMSAFMSLNRKMKGLPTQDGYGDIARRVVTYHMLVPMVFQWVALGLPGLLSDWDDEDEQALGRAALLGNLNALFLVGDILTAFKDLVSGAPWAGEFTTLPIFEQAGLVFKDVKSFMKATDPVKKDKYMWRMINHIVEFSGLPASNIHKMIKNIEALPDSKDPGEALLRLFNYSDYVIEGDKQKKDKEIEAYRKAMLGE